MSCEYNRQLNGFWKRRVYVNAAASTAFDELNQRVPQGASASCTLLIQTRRTGILHQSSLGGQMGAAKARKGGRGMMSVTIGSEM